MNQISSIRMNKIYRFIDICLRLADLADQKHETPFKEDISMGWGAFSSYMRQGVKELIDLKQDYYNALYRENVAEQSEKDARDFLEECFGDREIDSINDADKKQILDLCRQIEKEWENEEDG